MPADLLIPFGRDVNDFDLHTLSHDIFRGILFIEKPNRGGLLSWLSEAPVRLSRKTDDNKVIAPGNLKVSTGLHVGKPVPLAAEAAYLLMLFGIIVCSGFSVAASLLVNLAWPISAILKVNCSPWWYTRIVHLSSVNGFIRLPVSCFLASV